MTFSSEAAICAYIATLILHSYHPITTLSWAQNFRRKRALIMTSLATITTVFSEKFPFEKYWAICSFVAAIVIASLFLSHLRQGGGIWMSQRIAILTRLLTVALASGFAVIGIYWQEIWGASCIVLAFWNASILSRENTEITNEFRHIKNGLTNFFAERNSIVRPTSTPAAEPSDNSHKAS